MTIENQATYLAQSEVPAPTPDPVKPPTAPDPAEPPNLPEPPLPTPERPPLTDPEPPPVPISDPVPPPDQLPRMYSGGFARRLNK